MAKRRTVTKSLDLAQLGRVSGGVPQRRATIAAPSVSTPPRAPKRSQTWGPGVVPRSGVVAHPTAFEPRLEAGIAALRARTPAPGKPSVPAASQVAKTGERYSLRMPRNPGQGQTYIEGAVKGGVLSYSVRSEAKPKPISGSEMFDSMMHHFKEQKTPVDAVAAHWHFGSNLDAFDNARAQGKTEVDAAASTFGAKVAARWGYTEAVVKKVVPHPVRGASSVEAEFTKPKDK